MSPIVYRIGILSLFSNTIYRCGQYYFFDFKFSTLVIDPNMYHFGSGKIGIFESNYNEILHSFQSNVGNRNDIANDRNCNRIRQITSAPKLHLYRRLKHTGGIKKSKSKFEEMCYIRALSGHRATAFLVSISIAGRFKFFFFFSSTKHDGGRYRTSNLSPGCLLLYHYIIHDKLFIDVVHFSVMQRRSHHCSSARVLTSAVLKEAIRFKWSSNQDCPLKFDETNNLISTNVAPFSDHCLLLPL